MRRLKIVLTGGPCAGKTTVAQVLEKAFGNRLVMLPESASLLFRGGFPRWQGHVATEALQRAIYAVQGELEAAYAEQYPDHVLVMDRGTVDGAAYWPGGPVAFFEAMNSSEEAELERYDLVVYLESAGRLAYEENRRRNPNRTETWEEAVALDEATRDLWKNHPRFVEIRNNTAFSSKIAAVLAAVEFEINRKDVPESVSAATESREGNH